MIFHLKNKLKFKMQNKNQFRRDFLSKNFQQKFEQQKKINKKEKEKEKLSLSQRAINRNNHVHYYSKSSNKTNININKEADISKKLSFNDIDDDEELDHPRPLLSDIEEEEAELFILKNKFIKKTEDKKKLKVLGDGKNNLNLKFIPKSSEIPKIKDLPPEPKENSTNIKNIPFKSYKSETISKKQINNIKAQINNKMNYIINNNDIINYKYITDKKIKPKNQQIINSNKVKPRLNNSKKYIYENEKNSSNCQLNTEINNNLIINENKSHINIQNNPNNISNNNNDINNKKNVNQYLIKQNSKKKIIINNQKQQVHSVYIPKSKIKIKNENEDEKELPKKTIQEDNYFQKNMTQTEPNINLNLNKTIQSNTSKIKTLIKRKPINITNINNLLSNHGTYLLESDRGVDINKEDIPEIPKSSNTHNNVLKFSKMKSSEIKSPNLEKKNNSFINKFDSQENHPKYRTKTFERGGKFNNIQTTYVVISKKNNSKGIPKANISPKIIDYNKYKLINPIPSANCLNNAKLYKGGGIPQHYSIDLRFQRMTFNESKKVGNNSNSQNNIPVKGWDNYKTLDINNKNYDTNYKKYLDSSINRKSDIYIEPPERNSNYSINKSVNNTQNTIPIYDYDYNYNYYYNNYDNYDNTNQIPNDPFIPYNKYYNNY